MLNFGSDTRTIRLGCKKTGVGGRYQAFAIREQILTWKVYSVKVDASLEAVEVEIQVRSAWPKQVNHDAKG